MYAGASSPNKPVRGPCLFEGGARHPNPQILPAAAGEDQPSRGPDNVSTTTEGKGKAMMEHRVVAERMAELGMAAALAVERGDYRAAADNLRAGQMKLLGEMLEAGNVSPGEAVEIIEAVDAMHADFVAKHC